MRLFAALFLVAAMVYGQGSKTPIYNGILQSDLDANGFSIVNLVGGGGGGGITSITATTPIVVTPSPIVATGVISLDSTSKTNWDTAFTQTRQWDGGATGLTAATGRTSLGLVIGTNVAPATSGSSILYGNGSGGFSNVTIGTNLTFTTGTLNATGGGASDFTGLTGDFALTQTPSLAADKLIGRGNGGGAGDWQAITLGTNLSMTGTTLNASGGGGVAWGAITGTLSSQTDLQTALDAKLATAGDLSPLFTTTEATQNVAFSLTSAAATTVFGRAAGTSGAPTYSSAPQFLKIGNLTTNGFVKTGSSDGTLSVDTATYLTANQNISLTGDVTGGPSATSIATTIGNNKVTLGMMATMATDSILGRATALTGNVEVLAALPWADTGDVTRPIDSKVTTLAAGNAGNLNSGTLLAARMPALTGDVTMTVGTVATTLAAGNAGNLNSGTLLAARMPAYTGDVTSSVGTTANVIANNAVTYGKMQAVSAVDKLLGSSHTTTPVQEITLGTNLSMSGTTLNATGGGGTTFIGLTDVPASYSGSGGKLVAVNSGATALEFISAAGGGNVSNSGTPTAGQYGRWVTATTIEGVAASTVRTDLALVIGTNVQAWDTDLDVWATKTPYAGTVTVTTGKTFNCTGNLTLSGTDGSTLNMGAGGTLGTAAYTASSAYEVPLTFSTGLTRSTNTVTVNTSQNIAKLSNLTTNGFVKTSSSDGTLSVDTATYQAADSDLTTWAGITPTTVGQSFVTLTNPGAITFPEISATNVVSAKTAAQLKTDLSLTIGTNVQAWDTDLDTWAAITRASGFDTFTATSSSANLRTLLTDENGTGAALFNAATSPDFTTSVTIGSVAVPTISSTSTLTNKRINPRVTTITSNATLSPNGDTDDIYAVSALAAAITTISAPTGTPVDGQKLIIRVISDSSVRAISGWNAIYRFSSALAAPSTTVASSTHTWGFMYNTTAVKWDCIAQATNP